jgi:hypothetical protein
MRKFQRDSKQSRHRLVGLGALLVIAAVWAQAEMAPRRRSAPGHAPAPSAGTAIAMPSGGPVARGDQATPGGWGTDPFDPRPLGTTPVPTGR